MFLGYLIMKSKKTKTKEVMPKGLRGQLEEVLTGMKNLAPKRIMTELYKIDQT